jgi:hypothetical protein
MGMGLLISASAEDIDAWAASQSQRASSGFETDEDEYRRAFLFEGVSWRNQYVRVVHGELSREQTRGDAPWQAWKSGAGIAVREGRRDRRSESDPL